jgi:hypothetical protein
MQKSFVAIAFALTVSCAFAAFSTNAYVKAPVAVTQDTDYNFTNMSNLGLAAITIGDVYLLSSNVTINTANGSANSWSIWYKKLDAKTLSTGANSTATFTAPVLTFYYNNYAVSISGDNDTNTPQLRAYQVPLTGGAALPRITLTSNTNQSWVPGFAAMGMIGKTIYVFHLAANQKVNITNFQVGASTLGSMEFTMTSTYDTTSLSVVWGESLGSSQLFAVWVENGVLKDTIVDVSKGTVAPVTVGAYDKTYSCSAYATDKKWFGELCMAINATQGTVNYYIRTNTTSLAPMANYFTNTSSLASSVAYGPYLALIFRDSITSTPSASYNYEIWNLDTITTFKNRTQFLTIDTNSTVTWFRVPQGGLYTLLYNNRLQTNGTLTSVQVGLLLGSSYLATVFGFLLTIIAGLFLF